MQPSVCVREKQRWREIDDASKCPARLHIFGCIRDEFCLVVMTLMSLFLSLHVHVCMCVCLCVCVCVCDKILIKYLIEWSKMIARTSSACYLIAGHEQCLLPDSKDEHCMLPQLALPSVLTHTRVPMHICTQTHTHTVTATETATGTHNTICAYIYTYNIYIHIYICMYVCIYIYIYTYIHTYVILCVCVCVCVWMYVCLCLCTPTHTHPHPHPHTPTQIDSDTDTSPITRRNKEFGRRGQTLLRTKQTLTANLSSSGPFPRNAPCNRATSAKGFLSIVRACTRLTRQFRVRAIK
jgi:hypothetical protein